MSRWSAWSIVGMIVCAGVASAVAFADPTPPAKQPPKKSSPPNPVFEPQPIPGADFPTIPPSGTDLFGTGSNAPSQGPRGVSPQSSSGPQPESSKEALLRGAMSIPGIQQYITPDGIILPGGAGVIRPGADQIGVQINTPQGPILFNVPRRHRRAESLEPPPAPGSQTDAPVFGKSTAPPKGGLVGQAPTSPDTLRSDEGSSDRLPGERHSHAFSSAGRAFYSRNFPLALRRVDRYLQREPANNDLIQVRSLVAFANGDYRDAARDAMSVLAEDQFWSWPTLRSLYHSADEYTAQYRSLENRAVANPQSPELWFLLAYHNLMLGNQDAARRQFERVAHLEPGNTVAQRYARNEPSHSQAPNAPPTTNAPQRPFTPTPATPGLQARPVPQGPILNGPFSIDLGKPAPTLPTPAKSD